MGNHKTASSKTILVVALVLIAGIATASILATQREGADVKTWPAKLLGGGSTFINPLMQRWAYEFRVQRGLFLVDYQSIGSGQGIAKFKDQAIDFGVSDGPLKRADWEELKDTRGGVIHIPIAVGAVVAAFNIPEIEELRLDSKVLLGIFDGSISKWDDPRLVKLNPALGNIDEDIIVVYRADRSGTTFIWTDYLGMLSKGSFPADFSFKLPADESIKRRFLGAKGNEGVTEAIKRTPYSIGYVELSYAVLNDIKHAKLENNAGNFVKASRESISSAVKAVLKEHVLPAPVDDWSGFSLLRLKPNAEDSYPVVSFVYALVYVENPPDRARALREFLSWILNDGQQYALDVEGYVPLPDEAVSLALDAISLIKG